MLLFPTPLITLSNLHRYNSILFPVTGATAYMVAYVTPEFQKGGNFSSQVSWETLGWEPRPGSGSNSLQHSILLDLQQKAQSGDLVELTKEECFYTYLPDPQRTQYRNLIAISDGLVSNDSVNRTYYSTPFGISTYWICIFEMSQEFEDAMEKLSSGSCDRYSWLGFDPVSRCLAEPVTSPCSLKYSRNIHLAVIAANSVKVIAMVVTLLLYKTPALVTVGDAIASFLERPDPTTQGQCLWTNEEFAVESWSPGPKRYMISNIENLRQSTGAPFLQWVVTSAMYVALHSVHPYTSFFRSLLTINVYA